MTTFIWEQNIFDRFFLISSNYLKSSTISSDTNNLLGLLLSYFLSEEDHV